MQTITKTYKLFNFSELNETAQEKAKSDLYETITEINNDNFYCDVMQELKTLFPKSDLKIQYSLSSCQGDGVNIYGTFSLFDILEKIKDLLTEKEYKTLKFYFSYVYEIKLFQNYHYSFCLWNNGYNGNISDLLDDACIWNTYIPVRGYKNDVVLKFDKLANNYFSNLCREYEKRGYSEIYDLSYLSDFCDDNEIYFLENGVQFAG